MEVLARIAQKIDALSKKERTEYNNGFISGLALASIYLQRCNRLFAVRATVEKKFRADFIVCSDNQEHAEEVVRNRIIAMKKTGMIELVSKEIILDDENLYRYFQI